jgi:chromosome segregation ATPase
VQTDTGKYNYSLDPTSGAVTLKEKSLTRQVEHQDERISEMQVSLQELRDQNRQLELRLQQKDSEFQAQRREAMNASETVVRRTKQLEETQHRCNLYRVEVEDLIKQIDVADAKTRSTEDQLALKEAEFDRKLKQIEDRILFKRNKTEEREILEVRRDHEIEKEHLQLQMEKFREENDYLKTKVDKLETTNKELRLKSSNSSELKKLESEVQYL